MLIKSKEAKSVKVLFRAIKKNPINIIFVPVAAYYAFANRVYSKTEQVYLIDTRTEDLLGKLNNDMDDNIDFKILSDYKEIQEIIESRAKLDNDSEYKQIVRNRLQKGDSIAILFDSVTNQSISFLFLAKKEIQIPQVDYRQFLPKGYFAIYDVYTFPDYRKKGYYERLIRNVVKNKDNGGYKNFYLWVMPHNTVSLKAHNRIGINHVVKVLSKKYRLGIPVKAVDILEFNLEKIIRDE